MPTDSSAAEKHDASLRDFDLLTLFEVASLLHCSKAHVSNVIAGRVPGCSPIPAVRLGRRMLVRRETLAAWVARNEYAAANDNHGSTANDNLKSSPERGLKRG
jgi:excisionase family DNA binding protein